MAVVLDFPKSEASRLTFHEMRQRLPISAVYEILESLEPQEAATLNFDWRFWGRPSQVPPDLLPTGKPWFTWMFLGGRGVGKNWSGANLTNEKAKTHRRLALIGRTAADVRDTMVEGDSGLIAMSPPWFMPKYESTKRRVVWPNGSFALCFSADEPNLLRGHNLEFAWCDELAAWRRLKETWDNLLMCLRKGRTPQVIVTTTPRPLKILKDIRAMPNTHFSKGTTYENLENLAPTFLENVVNKYKGTRLGEQELMGEILDDNPNALWTLENIDQHRVSRYPQLDRIVVAVDPATAENPDEESSEVGIVVAGRRGTKNDNRSQAYVIADESVGEDLARVSEWPRAVVTAYHKYRADAVVAEKNNGGAMVRSVIQAIDRNIPVSLVTATRGKKKRAEPVSTVYELGRVHHDGNFKELEDQLTQWEEGSDMRADRMDALVWGITELFGLDKEPAKRTVVRPAAR